MYKRQEPINDQDSAKNNESNEILSKNDERSGSNDARNAKNKLNFLLTNARSSAPKLDSFIENFQERDIDLCVVSETWLDDGQSGLLQDDGLDLHLGEGISSFHCGRPVGRRGGGVGIFYRSNRVKAVEITPKNNPHEICAVLASLRGTSRKIIVIGAYLTTALTTEQAEVFLEYVNDMIHSFKARYSDPFFIVAGDWNKADTEIAFDDFQSIQEVLTPPTRGDENLDIVFMNMSRSVKSVEVCPPPHS